jgi:hypothetical protein
VFLVLIFASVSLGGHILQLQQDLDKLFQSNSGFRLEELGKDDPAAWNQDNANRAVQNNPALPPECLSTLESVEFKEGSVQSGPMSSAIVAYIFAGWGFPQNEEMLKESGKSGYLLISRLQMAHVLLKSVSNSDQISSFEVFSILLAIVLPHDMDMSLQVPRFEGGATPHDLITLIEENKVIWGKTANMPRERGVGAISDKSKVITNRRNPQYTPRQLIMQLVAVPNSIRPNGGSAVFIKIVVNALQEYQDDRESNPVWSQYNLNLAYERGGSRPAQSQPYKVFALVAKGSAGKNIKGGDE